MRCWQVLSFWAALQIFEGFANSPASLRGERNRRCYVGCDGEFSLADKQSQKLDLFKIPSTPGADHQVQFQFQMFQDTESPIKRLRHQRNHLPAGLERTQKTSPDRSPEFYIDFQSVPCLIRS